MISRTKIFYDLFFILKISLLFGAFSFSFSIISLFLPDSFVVGNPFLVSGISFEHIIGHIMWGFVAGIVTFSIKYAILCGLLPIVLDFDHLLQFLELDMIPRMAHSILFGIIVFVILIILFGRKDLRIPAISLAAVFVHMSFDIFLVGSTEFPLFVPFTTQMFTFDGNSWIYFMITGIVIIFVLSIIQLKRNKVNLARKFR
jgi:hypothetical protein